MAIEPVSVTQVFIKLQKEFAQACHLTGCSFDKGCAITQVGGPTQPRTSSPMLSLPVARPIGLNRECLIRRHLVDHLPLKALASEASA